MPRNNTKFNFDGKVGLSKRQLVYEVIKKYVREHQNISLTDLQHEFNGMHDGFMVCISEDEYNTYIKRTQTGSKRYFKEPIDLVSQKIFVCNQWGDNFKNVLNKMSELQYDYSSIIVESNDILEDEEKEEMIDNPKNIILYGPPGVGKTYSHKKLISILENGDNLDELTKTDYPLNGFENVKKEGRYQFLTFHQSYSYEDFVEGFRPTEEGMIQLQNGLFKDIAKQAKINQEAATAKEIKKDLDLLFRTLIIDVVSEGERLTIPMKRSRYHITEITDKSILFDKDSGESKHSLSINTLGHL